MVNTLYNCRSICNCCPLGALGGEAIPFELRTRATGSPPGVAATSAALRWRAWASATAVRPGARGGGPHRPEASLACRWPSEGSSPRKKDHRRLRPLDYGAGRKRGLVRRLDPDGTQPRRGQEDDGLRARGGALLAAAGRSEQRPAQDQQRHREVDAEAGHVHQGGDEGGGAGGGVEAEPPE